MSRVICPNATLITGWTAARYSAANITEDSRTLPHAFCLANDERRTSAPVRPTPVILYNPNSIAVLHGRALQLKFRMMPSCRYQPLHRSIQGMETLLQDVEESNMRLPLPYILDGGAYCVNQYHQGKGPRSPTCPPNRSVKQNAPSSLEDNDIPAEDAVGALAR